MPSWIVKQSRRVPRYVVEASSFEMDDAGTVTFQSEDGSDWAAITDVEYIKPDDLSGLISPVSLYDEDAR